MGRTASDFLVERLHDWGVETIFGYPGDGINGVFGALNRAKEKIRFVQSRHEELAAFEACAFAKLTGEVGVCLATSGPGAIHLLNGLYDAKMDNAPVVAIVGQQATTAIGTDFQQEVDLPNLYKDVASSYLCMAANPAQIRHAVDQAFRIAKADRTVTCVIVPNDVQEMDAVESPERHHGTTFTSVGYSTPEIVPRSEDLKKAAQILNSGQKVAMLVGAGALGASKEVDQAAELLGAGVAKALLGKAVLPDHLSYVTGAIGLLGTKPSWDMMMECDTLFMIGSSFPYSEFLPKEGQARGVQIDIKPRKLGLRFPMEVNLHGDSASTLRALMPMLTRKQDRKWQEGIQGAVREWWSVMETRAGAKADPINPQKLFWDLSSFLPSDSIITCDSGSAANWFARDIKISEGMTTIMSGGLATMCPAVPYAIAAKFAYPNRPVVATVGDGAMQMLDNAALITIGKYYQQWDDPRLVVLILNNRDLNQVTWEQRVMSGDPKFEASQNIPDFSYAQYAENIGLRGIRVERPEEISPAYEEAFSADRPVVIDALCDPSVPPLPPHITFEQAKGYMTAIFKGDPNAFAIAKQSSKEMMKTVLSHTKKP